MTLFIWHRVTLNCVCLNIANPSLELEPPFWVLVPLAVKKAALRSLFNFSSSLRARDCILWIPWKFLGQKTRPMEFPNDFSWSLLKVSLLSQLTPGISGHFSSRVNWKFSFQSRKDNNTLNYQLLEHLKYPIAGDYRILSTHGMILKEG